MFQKFYEFYRSCIFYKMHENFLSMRVSMRMYQIACVSRRIETWKIWILTELSLRLIIINLHTITTYSSHNVEMKMQAPTVSTYLSQKALSWQEHDSLHFANQFLSPNLAS